MEATFEKAFAEHLEFTTKTFELSTSVGVLNHCKKEIDEIISDIETGAPEGIKAIEYADAFGCLLDSANREGVTPELILTAFINKLQINKLRKWQYNGDGSYSHVK